MTNVIPLPDASVVLDLDAEERPESAPKPPYVVKVGGKVITFEDPELIDWRDLAAVEIPADMIRVSLSRDDRNHIMVTDLPSWKFSKLMEGYYNHYDLEEKIRQAKRQAAFNG